MQAPAVVTEFLKTVGPHPSAETYYEKAKEALWQVYPYDDSLKKELMAFIASSSDSPGLGFAGLALIPFHDPSTVKPILDRVLDRRISQATRWSFLNTVPYILSMGDAMYDGEGNLDRESLSFVKELRTAGEMASKTGAGHFHAVELRKIYDDKTEASRNSDYGLIILHPSAYLVGTLDLRDQTLLNVFLNPEQEAVCKNVIVALCLASNHDFLRALQEKEEKELTDEAVQAAVTAASSGGKHICATIKQAIGCLL